MGGWYGKISWQAVLGIFEWNLWRRRRGMDMGRGRLGVRGGTSCRSRVSWFGMTKTR